MTSMSMRGKESQQLGDILLEAREARGLSLDDLVERTDVRRSHLIALEGGHYEALPEGAYTKNILRLYAQTVGLDVTRMLHIYRQELRRAQASTKSQPMRSQRASASKEVSGSRAAPAPSEFETEDEFDDEATSFYGTPSKERRSLPRLGAFGRFATTLMLVVGVVALALWGFNALLFQPTPLTQAVPEAAPEVAAPPSDPAVSDVTSSTTSSAPADLILLSVNTTPPGAQVSVDGLPFDAVSPIMDAPVSAGESRTVRVSLAGYESVEQRVDLTQNRNLNISLSPTAGVVAADPLADTPAQSDVSSVTSAEGTAVFVVDAPAWLEVYASTARGEGERLYYGTAEAGETLTFDLPVYVHTGNGGGVNVAVDGEDRGTLGASGQVTGLALP